MSVRVIRWVVRIVALLFAVFLVLAGPVPAWLARVVPALSPLMLVAGVLGQKAWLHGMFWGIPVLLVVIIAMYRGRFFCRWLCPAGTLMEFPSRIPFRRDILKVRLSGFLFWAIVGSAIGGVPILLFLDPLSGFSRSFVWVKTLLNGFYSIVALVPGLVLPVFLVLSVFQPMIWCSHVCPLGYMFGSIRIKRGSFRSRFDKNRREIVWGLAFGLPVALLGRRFSWLLGEGKVTPVLPPGALVPEDFAEVCSRCYACVGVCPTGILRVGWKPGRSLSQFFQPEMDAEHGACEEVCNACGAACPTGAIQFLEKDIKRRRQIGVARVRRDACLAWADKEYCMVCDEHCPYNAIDTVFSDDGIPQPEVNASRCRGCGYCQNRCPAVRAGIAVVVEGVDEQKLLPDDTFKTIIVE